MLRFQMNVQPLGMYMTITFRFDCGVFLTAFNDEVPTTHTHTHTHTHTEV